MIMIIGLWGLALVFLFLFIITNEDIFMLPFSIMLVIAVATNICWMTSKYKAKEINKSFNKTYSTEDIFWNGGFIERQLMTSNSIVSDSKNLNVTIQGK